MTGPGYEIVLVHLNERAEFQLAGEFDLANAPELRRQLLDRLSAAIPVLVDMHAVTYVDSSALGVFVEALRLAEAKGTTFHLFGMSPSTRLVLEITGLTGLLAAEDTPAA